MTNRLLKWRRTSQSRIDTPRVFWPPLTRHTKTASLQAVKRITRAVAVIPVSSIAFRRLSPEQLRARLFSASGDELARLCQEHRQAVAEHFAAWQQGAG